MGYFVIDLNKPSLSDSFLTGECCTHSAWQSVQHAWWIWRTSQWTDKDGLSSLAHVIQGYQLFYIHTQWVLLIHFISVGYTSNDLIYQWTAGRGVNIASDMKLSQFDLISTPTGNETIKINHGNIKHMKGVQRVFPTVQETTQLSL